MKTDKLLIMLGVAASFVVAFSAYAESSSSFTSENQTEQTVTDSQTPPPPPASGVGVQNRDTARGEILKSSLRTDLTTSEKATLKTILDTYRQKRQALETGTSGNAENKAAKDALDAQLITDLIPYIIPEKIEAFKAGFVKPENAPKNINEKGPKEPKNESNAGGQKPGVIGQAKLLPDSFGGIIDKKLASFTTVEDKIVWITKILEKVDGALEKAKGVKAKALLGELKDLLLAKLEAVSGSSSSDDTSLINNLLEV